MSSGRRGPSVSAILCTRNRADRLAKCLSALGLLELDGIAFELVVVDNGSSDGTSGIVKNFMAQCRFPVRLIAESRPGLSRARNAGIRAAAGDILMFTDDDCYVRPDWVSQGLAAFGGDLRQIVGGRVDLFNPTHSTITTKTDPVPQKLTSFHQLHGFVFGANMAIGRVVHEEIGVFDTRFGAGTALRAAEDTEIVYRAFKSGIPIRYEPAMAVAHDHGRAAGKATRRLMFGYRMGNGALALKYFFKKDLDPLRLIYWQLYSSTQSRSQGKSQLGAWDTHLAHVSGMLLFLLRAGAKADTR